MRCFTHVSGLLVLAWILGSAPEAQAGLPSLMTVKVSIQMKDGKKVDGYVESLDDYQCDPMPQKGEYRLFDRINDKPTTWRSLSNAQEWKIMREVKILNYFPSNPQKSNLTEVNGRLSRVATPQDTVLVNINQVSNVKILECKGLNQAASILSLDKKLIKTLEKPAIAIFAAETYPEGVITLISYNEKFDSVEKLKTLLTKFAQKHPIPPQKPNPPWYEIYKDENEKEFRKDFLPENVYLLIYHVQD